MSKWINPVGFSLLALLALAHILLDTVDRRPYQDRAFYNNMLKEVEDLEVDLSFEESDSILIGWSKVSITPPEVTPLAGYGARRPKEFDSIHDSVFVRTVVFQAGDDRVAYVSADLLIIHPIVAEAVLGRLRDSWKKQEVFFSATHTHSSVGGWAPGFVGNLFSGTYNTETVNFLAERIVTSIEEAATRMEKGEISYNELQMPELVKNRLVGKQGTIDPWLKTLIFRKGEDQGMLNVYSAHATCLGHHYRNLSGDFPGALNKMITSDSANTFALYSAGAVGSMGPVYSEGLANEMLEAEEIANSLKENLELLLLMGPGFVATSNVNSYAMRLLMPPPGLKISQNLQLRPWLFKSIAGNYPMEIKLFVLGTNVFVGLPCDFSGELALPLYDLARELGLNLIITSFNGGYGGYIIKDEWYDLSKYEARTMSWYGPYAGSYLSEIIALVLKKLSDNG